MRAADWDGREIGGTTTEHTDRSWECGLRSAECGERRECHGCHQRPRMGRRRKRPDGLMQTTVRRGAERLTQRRRARGGERKGPHGCYQDPRMRRGGELAAQMNANRRLGSRADRRDNHGRHGSELGVRIAECGMRGAERGLAWLAGGPTDGEVAHPSRTGKQRNSIATEWGRQCSTDQEARMGSGTERVPRMSSGSRPSHCRSDVETE